MATLNRFKRDEINAESKFFTETRTIIETAFYGNNVEPVNSLKEAYKLAENSSGTIVTDMPIYQPEVLGLDEDAKILLYNDGAVHGRCAAARRIYGKCDVSNKDIQLILKEAVYHLQEKEVYSAQSYVGLDKDFMLKAHLLMPEGHENIMYNWLLNFQALNEEFAEMYTDSKRYQEGDLFIISDPDWKDERFPYGFTFFDPENNCAAILGMRYFGEHKKGTLTLGWAIASRNGYVSCHGGLKRYNKEDGSKFVTAVFGLSGSGKSTLTHAKHDGKYDVSILHDDAFIISTEDGSSVALEPSYFDKTADYPLNSPDNKYLLSVQNCGATLDEDGKVVVVNEDLRNTNGRAIKSKLWSPNRVNKVPEKIDAVIWLMKDPMLPPAIKITGTALGATMGALLATKRTSAERLAEGVDPNQIVIEPYANPFRTYPLEGDYSKFKKLFDDLGVDCYILNTGFFLDKKVTKEVTLGALEAIVEGNAKFEAWDGVNNLEIIKYDGFTPDMKDADYLKGIKSSMEQRLEFINKGNEEAGLDQLPAETVEAVQGVINDINKML